MEDQFPQDAEAELFQEERRLMAQAHAHAMGAVFVSKVVAGVEKRIGQGPVAPSTKPPVRSWRGDRRHRVSWFSPRSPARVAAALGLGAVVITGGIFVLGPRASILPPDQSGHHYVTATGQQATITLRDGSRVTLAPQTTLVMAPGFGDAQRLITVDGEAFFEVVADAKAPFVVRAGNVSTHVLGTAFSVRRYPEDTGVSVAVVDGKVEVIASSEQRPSIVLTAGMAGVVTDSSATTQSSASTYASWMRGRLVFQEAPVSDIIAALQRWYGYDFRIADSSLARQHLTVGLSATSASDALTALKAVWSVELKYQDSVIVVSPAQQGRTRPPAVRDAYSIPTTGVGR